jgi:hypothetical protein
MNKFKSGDLVRLKSWKELTKIYPIVKNNEGGTCVLIEDGINGKTIKAHKDIVETRAEKQLIFTVLSVTSYSWSDAPWYNLSSENSNDTYHCNLLVYYNTPLERVYDEIREEIGLCR